MNHIELVLIYFMVGLIQFKFPEKKLFERDGIAFLQCLSP